MKHNKKGQFSHGDFIVGFVIFSFALILFFKYSNYISPTADNNEFLLREGKLISNSLLSQGHPFDWTTGNVIIAGITNGESIINQTKILNLLNMNYQDTRTVFKTRSDYYFYFTNNEDNVILINGTKDGFGYSGINTTNLDSIDAEDIAKTTRLAILNSNIVKLVILTW